MKWRNLFGFEHMITPWLIRFLYIIGVVLIILGSWPAFASTPSMASATVIS